MSARNVVVILFIYLFAFVTSSVGVQYQWNGAVDTYWNTPGNWSPANVPGVNDTANFNSTSNNCELNTDILVTSIIFTAGYTGQFTMANKKIVVSGDMDFSSGGGFSVNASDTILFNSNGLQKVVGKPGTFLPVFIKDGTGTLEVHSAGFKTLGLLLKNGIISNVTSLSDTVNGDMICTGGLVRLNNGSLFLRGNADFSGMQNFDDTLGTIYFNGMANQSLKASSLVRFPVIEKLSSYDLVIGCNHFRARSLKVGFGQVRIDTTFNVDSIDLLPSSTLILDTAQGTHDTVKNLNGNGNLNLGNSELCFAGAYLDLSVIPSFSGGSGSSLAFIGANQSFTPSPFFMYKKIRRRGAGITTVTTNGLRVDTLELLSGEFNLGNGLIDSINGALKMLGGTLKFSNSTLRAGAHINLNGPGTIDPGTGRIEFSGYMDHVFVPRFDGNNPIVSVSSMTTHIVGNHFRAKRIDLFSGTLEMDTSFYFDTLNLGTGTILRSDSAAGNSDTINYIVGNGYLELRKSDLCFNGNIVNLSLINGISGGSISFIGSNQNFTPSTFFMYNKIRRRGTGITTVTNNGLRVDTLELISGEFNLGTGLVDSVRSAVKMMGGTLNFSSSTLRTGGNINLNGPGTIEPGIGGRIEFSGYMDRTFVPRSDGNNPTIVNYSMTTHVAGNHFKAKRVDLYGGTIELDTSFRLDTLNLGSGSTFRSDSAVGNSDTVGYIIGNGLLELRNSELCFNENQVDLNAINSISGGSLAFIGSNQTFIPPTYFMYNKIRRKGTGVTTVTTNGLRVDTLELISGEFHLGNGLTDSLGSTLKMMGGTLNFGSSLLRTGTPLLSMNGAGTIIPSTGGIEFISMSTQNFIPSAAFKAPAIHSSSDQLHIIQNRLRASKLQIHSGAVILDTTISVDTINVNSGATLMFDTVGNQKDTIGVIDGNGELMFGKTTIHINGDANFGYFNSFSGNADLEFGASVNRTFVPSSSFVFNKIKKVGTNTLTISSHGVRVKILAVLEGVVSWNSTYNDTIYDTIQVKNATLNLGSSPVAFRSLVDSNGVINFNYGTLVRFGGNGVINLAAAAGLSWNYGGINFEGSSGATVDLFPSPTYRIPPVHINGNDTIKVNGNFKGSTIFQNNGGWDWGNNFSHTIRALSVNNGMNAFGNSTIAIDSGSMMLESATDIRSGMATILFSAASGIQFLAPPSSSSLILPLILKNDTATLQIVNQNVRCREFRQTAGKIQFSGFGIIADSSIIFENVDSLIELDGVTLQAGDSIRLSGASGKMIHCAAASQWYVNVPGNLKAENAVIGNCIVSGTSGIAYPPYTDAGGNTNWIFWVDTFPPDNDLVLNVQALDTGRIRLWWNPSSIDSADAEVVGISYSSSKMPDSINDPAAIFLGTYSLSDTIDTVINLNAHTNYYFAAAVSDISGNWSGITTNSKKTIRTKAIAPYIISAPDTIHKQSFTVSWVNPPGLSALDSVFIHTALQGNSWNLYTKLSSSQNTTALVLPASEGQYKYMISTSQDSAGVYYSDDVFVKNVLYTVAPPVITIPKDTFNNYFPNITWQAPAGFGSSDSFFVFTDTITGNNMWVLKGQYSSNVLSHTLTFNNYGLYKVMVSTSWDKFGAIEQGNIAIDTLRIVPSSRIFTWDISSDSGFQASSGIWGSDQFWSNEGKTLTGWLGAGNSASFSTVTTNTVVGINGTQNADSVIFTASGYKLSGGTLALSTGVVRGMAVDTIQSILSSALISKTGSGEIVLGSKTLCDSLKVGNGLLTIIPADTGVVVPGVLSVYSRLSGIGRIANKVVMYDMSTFSPGSGSAGKVTANDFSMSANCTLNIDIGSRYDTISVKYSATVNGYLNISPLSGFGKGVYPLISCTGTMIDNGIKIAKTPYSTYTYKLQKEGSSIVLHIDTLIIDTTKPGIKINITSGSYFQKMPSVISGNARDSISGLLSVSLLINKSKDSTYWNGAGWQKGALWLQVIPESLWYFTSSGISSSEGTYIIKAGVTDSAGNMAYDTTNFVIDTTAPVITKMLDNLDSIGSWNGLVSGEVFDSFSLTKQVKISVKNDSGKYFDGNTWIASEVYLMCNGTKQWSRQIERSSLPEGNYIVNVIAADTVGNVMLQPFTKIFNLFIKKDPVPTIPVNLIQATIITIGDSLTTIKLKAGNTDNIQILFGVGELKELAAQNVMVLPNRDTVYSFRTILPGKIHCAYAVRDNAGNRSAFLYDSVVVNNIPPRLLAIADTIIFEHSTLVKVIQAYDINNDSIYYRIPVSKSEMSIAGSVFKWTPGNTDIGSHSVVIECRDTRGAAVIDTFNIVVTDLPESPEISYAGNFEVREDSSYEGLIKISDPDIADSPLVTIMKLPAWMKLSENKLTGVPGNEDVGIHSVELRCTDKSSLSDTVAFQIRVINTNDNPELIQSSVMDTVTEKQKYTFEIKIHDRDENDSITVKSVISKPWLKVSSVKKSENGIDWVAQLTCTPAQVDTGLHEIKFEIADKALAALYLNKKILILDSDDPPAKPVITRKIIGGAAQIAVSSTDDRDVQLLYSTRMRDLKNDSMVFRDSSVRISNLIYPISDGRYEFRVTAIDGGGLKSIESIDTFYVTGASEYVFKDTGWSMVSIPSKMYSVANLKNTKYLLNWDESGVEKQVYSYYRKKEELTDLEKAKAYWRKGDTNDTIHLSNSSFEKGPVTINMHKTVSGWNQISSPYPYPVAWPRKGDVVWRWNSKVNDYEEVQNVLEPWAGYWVRVDTAVAVTLSPVPFFSTGSLAKLRKSFFHNKDNWTLQVSIRTDGGSDADNKFGFNQNATDKFDELDRPEPPGFEGRPVLYFNREEWKTSCKEFASDIRKNWKSVNIFEFALSGSKEKENGTLSFDGLEGTSNLYVFTKIGDSLVRVEGKASYTVPLSTSKSYQTVFVTDNPKFLSTFPLHFKMGNPYPNPFCPTTRINYTLPYRWSGNGKINLEPYTVTIDIYDILGRKLRCLVYRKMTPGNYSVMWNGKSENGRIVASGKYYCVLKADELKQIRNLTLIK